MSERIQQLNADVQPSRAAANAVPRLVRSPEEVATIRLVRSPEEVAAALYTSPARVREYIKAGKMRAVRHGRRFLIPVEEIAAFIEREAPSLGAA